MNWRTEQNMQAFLDGATKAFKRSQEKTEGKAAGPEDVEPIISIRKVAMADRDFFQWTLICQFGLELSNDADQFADVGEARDDAAFFIRMHREKIRLEELKVKAEREEKNQEQR